MNKIFSILIILNLLAGGAAGPLVSKNTAREANNFKRDFKHFFPATDTSGQTGEEALDVLFATNADLELFINDKPEGTLAKSAHRHIKLPAGRYGYKAKSKTTADEFRDSFAVKADTPNEIFIDFLYFLDERNLLRESVKIARAQEKAQSTRSKKEAPDTLSKKAQALNKEAVNIVVNSILNNMVSVKGGRFIMGNNKAPAADEVEHPVSVSNVLFSKFEVTQQQWEIIMGYNPSKNSNCATCPVENVSWEEAMKFVRKLSLASNKKYRLPTEAEWEYVAKLGGKAEVDKAGGQEEYIKKTAWYFANSDKKTHPVGQKQPNVAGIYDLMGNVSEWCADWYGSYYYKDDDSQVNPGGPPLGKEKVVRGASFMDYTGDQFRPSYRQKKAPTVKSESIGLRLVMDAG